MARNGSGTYSLPESPFVNGTVIDEVAMNSNFSDIATEITNSVDKDGQTTWTGDMNAGGNRINNLTGITVQSSTSTRMLYVDETNDRVGIGLGNLAPTDGILHIQAASAGAVAALASRDDIVVESDNFCGMTFLCPTTKASYIAFGDTDNNTTGLITYDHSADTLYFHVEGTTEALAISDSTGFVFNESGSATQDFRVETDTVTDMFFIDAGTQNVHINNTTSAASSVGNLHIGIGTSPTASITDGIVIGSKDSSAGATDATVELWLETDPVVVGTFTASHKFPIWINGTEYHIQLDAV